MRAVSKPAPKCKMIGCARKTRAQSGYCFQHSPLAPTLANGVIPAHAASPDSRKTADMSMDTISDNTSGDVLPPDDPPSRATEHMRAVSGGRITPAQARKIIEHLWHVLEDSEDCGAGQHSIDLKSFDGKAMLELLGDDYPVFVGSDASAAWSPINTMDALCDDLVWLALIDRQGTVSIDGPRIANTDDYDTFSVWAPCEPPPNARSGRVQKTIGEMVEDARIRAKGGDMTNADKLRLIRAIRAYQVAGGGAGRDWDIAIFDAGYAAGLAAARRECSLQASENSSDARAVITADACAARIERLGEK